MTSEQRRRELMGGTERPTFKFKRIEMKAENGQAVFSYYDSNMEKNITYSSSFGGVLLGEAMALGAYNQKENAFYKSGIYLSNDNNVSLYAKGNRVFQGTVMEAKAYLSSMGLNPKTRKVLFVLTHKGEVVAIHTNVSIAIAQMKNAGDKKFTHEIKIEPKLYDPNDDSIAGAREYLGPLAASNPPRYASFTFEKEITPDLEASLGINAVLDDFSQYVTAIKAGPSVTKTEEDIILPNTPSEELQPETADATDDLPF